MTDLGGNNYEVTISDGTYVTPLTVASHAGGETSSAVTDATPADDVVNRPRFAYPT